MKECVAYSKKRLQDKDAKSKEVVVKSGVLPCLVGLVDFRCKTVLRHKAESEIRASEGLQEADKCSSHMEMLQLAEEDENNALL